MWNSLTENEKNYGMKWAKQRIDDRLNGSIDDLPVVDKENFAFSAKETAKRRDNIIVDMILKKYKKIKRIPNNVSPHQLKKEGIVYAFTESGSIGQEYPALGIQVITAGVNPYSKFDFCWNPKNAEEFDQIVFDLKNRPFKNNLNELYEFYALRYLYYDWNWVPARSTFFKNRILEMDSNELISSGFSGGTWLYAEYLKECDERTHEKTIKRVEYLMNRADEWRPDVLYKRNIRIRILVYKLVLVISELSHDVLKFTIRYLSFKFLCTL